AAQVCHRSSAWVCGSVRGECQGGYAHGRSSMSRAIWPKEVPALTPEQRIVADDFMKFWHEVLPQRYGLVESFNHGYAVRSAPKNFCTTLEIGAGLGEHLSYERL